MVWCLTPRCVDKEFYQSEWGIFWWFLPSPLSFRYQFGTTVYHFGRTYYQFANNLVSKFIFSVSFRRNELSIRWEILSIRYQFGGTIIFPATEFIVPVLFSIFPVEYSDITGLITIFPRIKNDFSGLVLHLSGLTILKLSRLCRCFPKLLISNLSFRVSIRGFCRNFVDIYREFSENLWEFSETAGKIPKR